MKLKLKKHYALRKKLKNEQQMSLNFKKSLSRRKYKMRKTSNTRLKKLKS
jgi:hypothetical protein